MINSQSACSYYLSGIAMLVALSMAACGTGNNQACDGRTSALCATGGADNTASAGGSAGTTTAGSTGGYLSTSTTVLKIERNVLRDLSKPNPSGSQTDDPDAGDDGAPVILHGVNRSGTEYQCVKGAGIFDGPSDEASIQAIAGWKVNAVRVPLNESCWLNINDSPPFDSGAVYKSAIQQYVALLHKYNIYPILELHWVGYGTTLATGQLPMADADHALDFWTDVATTFKNDLGVVFELYNEPYFNVGNLPDISTNVDNDAAWQCWENGCTQNIVRWSQVDGGWVPQILGSYQTAGFQQLVNAVRTAEGNTAASHVILLGGVQYSNRLTQWAKYKPTDPANNLGAAWHIYNNNGCASTSCFDGVPATLSATTAIVATEFGENDCGGTIVTPWMQWFDDHQISYLAWSWDVYGPCASATDSTVINPNPWPLVTNYDGTPNAGFGQTVHDHFVAIAP